MEAINEALTHLALRGAILDGLLGQEPQIRGVMLDQVAGGHWRVVLEPQEDGDAVFVCQVRVSDGWASLARVHRAQLGLPRVDDAQVTMLAALGQDAPEDVSGLDG